MTLKVRVFRVVITATSTTRTATIHKTPAIIKQTKSKQKANKTAIKEQTSNKLAKQHNRQVTRNQKPAKRKQRNKRRDAFKLVTAKKTTPRYLQRLRNKTIEKTTKPT